MEDIIQVLLVVGFLVIGFVKQIKKETTNGEIPQEGATSAPEDIPMPEDFPAFPQETETIPPTTQPTPNHTRKTTQKYQPISASPPMPVSSLTATEQKEETDYGIHSVEEARRAFIWSEILQRKYE